MKDDLSVAFCDASQFFVDVVSSVPTGAWLDVGLGEWNVLELVAHGNRAHTTIEDYVINPQPTQPPDSFYFAEKAIAARAREGVDALGHDPVATIMETAVRCRALVEKSPLSVVVGSPAGTMPLAEYLPSRVAELVIHGMDVARAIQKEIGASPTALGIALAFVADRSTRNLPDAVLMALTGRGPLPVDYNVF